MNQRTAFLAALLVMLLYPVSSFAYIGLCCGKCGGNMPMNILGAGVPETHEFRLKLSSMYMRMDGMRDGDSRINENDLLGMPSMGKYMAVPTEMDMYMTNLAVGYSFTDDIFGGIMFMWKQNRMKMKFNSMMSMPPMMGGTGKSGFTMKSEGIADTMLMTKYRLYADDPLIPTSQLSLLVALSLPTGSINEKNSNHPLQMRKSEQLPYGMQLGSGTFDPTFGLQYSGSSSPLWWGANVQYTGRWNENSRDYRLGDEFRYDLYTMYQFRYDAVLDLQLNGRHRGEIRGEMDEASDGSSGRAMQGNAASNYATPLWDPDNYGGDKISATVGVQWQPFPMSILEMSFGVPIYQRLNGPQLEEDYRMMLTWYFEIPTAASVRYTGKKKGKSKLGF